MGTFLEFFPAWENKPPQTPTGDRVRFASIMQENRFIMNSEGTDTFDLPEKKLIISIVNVFETGSVEGDYGCVSVYGDGPLDENGQHARQVTYGRSQTTEYGLLPVLLKEYVNAKGELAEAIHEKMGSLGTGDLCDDDGFLQVLRDAGNDPVMRGIQDRFFDRMYWNPAFAWWKHHGFLSNLALLVIYDSFVHSGGVLGFLRTRIHGVVPTYGGDEQKWISAYVEVRDGWLRHHPNSILRKTVYRTECFRSEVERGNWDLSMRPIYANGVEVS